MRTFLFTELRESKLLTTLRDLVIVKLPYTVIRITSQLQTGHLTDRNVSPFQTNDAPCKTLQSVVTAGFFPNGK